MPEARSPRLARRQAPGIPSRTRAATTTTIFVSLWNPDLGARQDWDLLSVSALPTMALAAFLLVSLVPRGDDRRYCGLLLLAVGLYHTGLWVVSNSLLAAVGLGP